MTKVTVKQPEDTEITDPKTGSKREQIKSRLEKLQKEAAAFQKKVEKDVATDNVGATEEVTADEVTDETEVGASDYQGMDQKTKSAVDRIQTGGAAATELTQKMSQDWQKRKEEAMKALKEAGVDTEGKNLRQALTALREQKPQIEAEAKLKEAKKTAGVGDWMEKTQQQSVKVAKLQGDIDKLEVEKLNALQETEALHKELGSTMRFMKGDKGEVERRYDVEKAYKSAELGAQAALLQAYSGNLEQARSIANDVVQAYKFDAQQKREDFDTLFSVYGSWVQNLEQDKKSILENARQDAIREEKRVEREKKWTMEMMMEYQDAGINIDDDKETVAKKAQKAAAQEEETMEAPTVYGSSSSGYYTWDEETGEFQPAPGMEGIGGGIQGIELTQGDINRVSALKIADWDKESQNATLELLDKDQQENFVKDYREFRKTSGTALIGPNRVEITSPMDYLEYWASQETEDNGVRESMEKNAQNIPIK